MVDSIRLREDGGVEALIPKALYMAVVKTQSAEGLSWSDACARVAELSEAGSEKFEKDVKAEARRLQNSQLMKQLNKGRETIRSTGYSSGSAAAKRAYEVYYFCSICQEKITVTPNSDSHKAMIEYMNEHGWAHSGCRERQP